MQHVIKETFLQIQYSAHNQYLTWCPVHCLLRWNSNWPVKLFSRFLKSIFQTLFLPLPSCSITFPAKHRHELSYTTGKITKSCTLFPKFQTYLGQEILIVFIFVHDYELLCNKLLSSNAAEMFETSNAWWKLSQTSLILCHNLWADQPTMQYSSIPLSC
jgi:hypothetical protein